MGQRNLHAQVWYLGWYGDIETSIQLVAQYNFFKKQTDAKALTVQWSERVPTGFDPGVALFVENMTTLFFYESLLWKNWYLKHNYLSCSAVPSKLFISIRIFVWLEAHQSLPAVQRLSYAQRAQ
jgi:hypothetical protein